MTKKITTIATSKSVAEVIDALQIEIEQAGATVFARVNHGGGAISVGLDIGSSELLIFGNPKLGTQPMIDDPLAALFLPLKVLGYRDVDQQVRLAYEDPAETLKDLNIPANAGYIGVMRNVLEKLTTAAAK